MCAQIILMASTVFVLGAIATALSIDDSSAKTKSPERTVSQPKQLIKPKQTNTTPSNGSLDWVIDHAKGSPG
jgi:hypothetical protein